MIINRSSIVVQVTPKISATEAAALEAGTIGFDRDIFDGTASLQSLKDKYPMAKLTDREQAFLDNEVGSKHLFFSMHARVLACTPPKTPPLCVGVSFVFQFLSVVWSDAGTRSLCMSNPEGEHVCTLMLLAYYVLSFALMMVQVVLHMSCQPPF